MEEMYQDTGQIVKSTRTREWLLEGDAAGGKGVERTGEAEPAGIRT